ncbi:ester cyclase [Natronosalvus rutilus]|uniref:Ester cyclase n=1 Tax=Natronosalvus rutilus TaxID=2953753 RepID=A0A9E7N5S6_9EURY|nr:ester cyclase [Natronosalvus rutilus]UTF52259.1 ester cyclase [Natronosalvus rutilus]
MKCSVRDSNPGHCRERGPTDSQSRRIATSLRDVIEVWEDHDLNAINEIYTSDYRGQDFPLQIPVTRTRYRKLASLFITTFPDCSIEVETLTADEDFINFEWIFTGTHTGTVYGTPPSYAAVSFTGKGRHRHENGKVAEVWMDVDWKHLYTQLARGYWTRFQ